VDALGADAGRMLTPMQRIKNSWELAKVSWSVLKGDRTLMVFPVLSAVIGLIVVGVIAGLVALTGVNNAHGSSGLKGIGYVFIVIGYVALAFVTTYFLGALVHGANEALDGKHAEVGECFDAANAKLHRLLPWAIVQATVSIIIQALEERGFLGQIVASLIGAAWAVVTFLTVPIIMLEDLGPINALKRSGHLLKQSWGENIAAQAGFGIFSLVAILPAAIVLGLVVSSGSTVLIVTVGAVAVAWAVVVSLAISALSGIYRTALYRFAVDGVAPPAFAGTDLQHAFGPRRRRSGLGA
jgi:hypothetical protein